MDKMITVATFHLPQDAYIIRGRIESEGIFCYLKDELTVQSDNIISNAIGGVKLQVHESDVQKVLPILEEAGLIEKEFTIGRHAPEKGMPRELKFVLASGALISGLVLIYYFFLS